jgi:hypothetical protein
VKCAKAQVFYADEGETSIEIEKLVFHPTNGREGETACILTISSFSINKDASLVVGKDESGKQLKTF